MQNALSILGREALRIVLPSWCIVCESELPWRERTASCCASCWAGLPRIASAKCRSCALPLSVGDVIPSESEGSGGPGGTKLLNGAAQPPDPSLALGMTNVCIECSVNPLPLEWCEAWGLYQSGLERVLHAFKFQKHDFLDRPLAALLEETLRSRGDLAFDAIVPVPMHRTKRRKRGYNQAELLSKALAQSLLLRNDVSLLTKRMEREPQSSLKRAARAANVRGTFQASQAVAGQSILIVDDICTTGETLRSCAEELLDRGATRVCAIALAKAV